jgi:HlyD family secretion protein
MEIRTENRRTLWIAWAALGALALVVALAGCQGAAQARAERDLSSKDTVVAFVGELSAEASASGEVLAQREAVMSFGTPGRVEEVYVEVGQEVQAGDVLVQLESDALGRALQTAEQNLAIQEANLAELRKEGSEPDIAAAQAALASVQAQLDDLLAGPSELELLDAEAALASARAQLDDLLAGPSRQELARARAALDSAQAAVKAEAARYAAIEDQLIVARRELDLAAVDLESAKYFYDALKNDWQHKDYADFSPEVEVYKDAQTAYNVALARYNLNAAGIDDGALRNAQSQLAQAEANLAALTEVKTVEIAAAREQIALAEASMAALTEAKTAQIAAARAQLAQAEANLGDLLEGASPERVAITEAQVEQARIQVADAQARLAKSRLIAPFDGVVTAVHVEVGELSSGPAVEMVEPSSLEVVLDVDEVDIGNIAVGQDTLITLEAWPDRELEGKVVAIAPKARAQSEVVIYQVHISTNPGDLPIRAGMTANADLITSRREDVLLVANRAITADRKEGTYYVYRKKGDVVDKVEIAVGLRDRTYTEITSGLDEGDELVIGYDEALWAMDPEEGPPEGIAVEAH